MRSTRFVTKPEVKYSSSQALPRYFSDPNSPPEPYSLTDASAILPRHFSDPRNPPKPYDESHRDSTKAPLAVNQSLDANRESKGGDNGAITSPLYFRDASMKSAYGEGSESSIYKLLLVERRRSLIIAFTMFLSAYMISVWYLLVRQEDLQVRAGRMIQNERKIQVLRASEELAKYEKKFNKMRDERNQAMSRRNRDTMLLTMHIAMLRKQLVEQAGIEPGKYC